MEFYQVYTDSREPLEMWYKVCKKADWKKFSEVKEVYSSVDWVGDNRAVFNIKGNKYRLIVRFSFSYKAMQVRWIGTHSQFNDVDVHKI